MHINECGINFTPRQCAQTENVFLFTSRKKKVESIFIIILLLNKKENILTYFVYLKRNKSECQQKYRGVDILLHCLNAWIYKHLIQIAR